MKQIIKAELFRIRKENRFKLVLIAIILILLSTLPVMYYEYKKEINHIIDHLNGASDAIALNLEAVGASIAIQKEAEASPELIILIEELEAEKEYLSSIKYYINQIIISYNANQRADHNSMVIQLAKKLSIGEELGYQTYDDYLSVIIQKPYQDFIDLRNELTRRKVNIEFSKYEINSINILEYIYTNYPIYLITFLFLYYLALLFCDIENPDVYKAVYVAPYNRYEINICRIIVTILVFIISIIAIFIVFSFIIAMLFSAGSYNYVELITDYYGKTELMNKGDWLMRQIAVSSLVMLSTGTITIFLAVLSTSFTLVVATNIITLLLYYISFESLVIRMYFPLYYLSYTNEKGVVIPYQLLILILIGIMIFFFTLSVLIAQKKDMSSSK